MPDMFEKQQGSHCDWSKVSRGKSDRRWGQRDPVRLWGVLQRDLGFDSEWNGGQSRAMTWNVLHLRGFILVTVSMKDCRRMGKREERWINWEAILLSRQEAIIAPTRLVSLIPVRKKIYFEGRINRISWWIGCRGMREELKMTPKS